MTFYQQNGQVMYAPPVGQPYMVQHPFPYQSNALGSFSFDPREVALGYIEDSNTTASKYTSAASQDDPIAAAEAFFGVFHDAQNMPTKNPDAMTDEEIWDKQVTADANVRYDTAEEVQRQKQTIASRMKKYRGGIDDEGWLRIKKSKTAGFQDDLIKILKYVEIYRPYFYDAAGNPYSRPPQGAYTVWQGLQNMAVTQKQREYILAMGFDIAWTQQPVAKDPKAKGTTTLTLPPMVVKNRKIDAKTPAVKTAGVASIPWWAWGFAAVAGGWFWYLQTPKQKRYRRGRR